MKIPFLGLDITKSRQSKQAYTIYSSIRAAIDEIVSILQLSNDRIDVYRDIDRMYNEDGYVAEAIDILTGDILARKDPYEQLLTIECADERLKNEIESIIAETNLEYMLRTQIIHNYLKYGNAYCEYVVYPGTLNLADLVFIPDTWSVWRNVNDHGQLKNGDPGLRRVGECAYDQRDDTGRFLAGFKPYQILHFRMPPFRKDGNGIPFLMSARRNWLRLQLSEDSTVRARLLRAFMKLIHHIPMPDDATPEQREQYTKQYIQSQLKMKISTIDSVYDMMEGKHQDRPPDVATDYYLPETERAKGKIDVLDPQNTQLQNLKDLEYFQNEKFARLKVPKARMANERDVNAKATLIEQFTAYAGTIVTFQTDVLFSSCDMINRTLFFRGYPLERIDYKLMLPSPFVKNEMERAQTELLWTRRAEALIRIGLLSRDTVRQTDLDMDEKESKQEGEKAAAEREEFPQFTGMFANQVPSNEEMLRELHRMKRDVKNNGHENERIAFKR